MNKTPIKNSHTVARMYTIKRTYGINDFENVQTYTLEYFII